MTSTNVIVSGNAGRRPRSGRTAAFWWRCLERLATTAIGRVVVTTPATRLPIIRPVNYVFDQATQSVVFRTSSGSKLYALLHSAHAWFEIDSFDLAARSGWSVIVGGVSEQVTRPSEIRRLSALGLKTWAPGEKSHWIRIRARTVSGRRTRPGPPPNAVVSTDADGLTGTEPSAPSR
jgi:nitroimidazol reductase NimA-like FMN-containing flavoprotein (pyridoxamine 5'-phosphate oxidase superfamily)